MDGLEPSGLLGYLPSCAHWYVFLRVWHCHPAISFDEFLVTAHRVNMLETFVFQSFYYLTAVGFDHCFALFVCIIIHTKEINAIFVRTYIHIQ